MKIEVVRREGSRRNTHVITWDTLTEQVEAATAAKPAYIQMPTDGRWTGRKLHSWDELAKACREPWEHGIKLIEDMAKQIATVVLPSPKNIRRRPLWSEDGGDDFDLDRYRSGQEFWRTTNRRPSGGPQIITMLVHTGGNAHVKPDDLLWRGAIAVAIADILEARGYRAEILAYDCGSGVFISGDDEVQAVWLKRSHDPMDIATLANGVSGWYFRTIMFAGYSVCPGQTPLSTLGRETALPEWLKPRLSHERAWIIQNINSMDQAIAFAKNVLATLSASPEADKKVPVGGAW